MKTATLKTYSVALILSFLSPLSFAQGTFVYDQQSSDESQLGGGATSIQSSQPMGQSFTPSLTSVGFIRLYLSDDAFNSLGATIYVNMRADSITGTILGSSVPVFVADRFIGPANFIFSAPVPVTPEVTYFFQPVIQSGDNFSVYAYNSFNYARGTAFANGTASPAFDLWFREGIVVPEPSSWALLLVGCGVLVWRRLRTMKATSLKPLLVTFAISTLSLSGYAQGTFHYDQQSSIEGFPGEFGIAIQPNQPVGQSFSPSFNAVGFVRLRLADLNSGNGLGATVYVILRAASIAGPILATAVPFFMPDGFGVGSNAFVDFFFSAAVPVTPGGTYIFQPVVQSGDFWSVGSHNGFDYSSGTAIIGGVADQFNNDLWFREGMVVPEPSTWALLLVGFGVLVWRRRER